MKNQNIIFKSYLSSFLEGYRFVIENRYSFQYESNPEAFPFMKNDNYTISIILLNASFFEYPNVIIISNDPTLEKEYDFRNQNSTELSKHYSMYTHESEAYIINQLDVVNLENYNYYTTIFHGTYPDYSILEYKIENFYNYGKRFAEDHFTKFTKISQERMIDKLHNEIQPFNHLDLSSMKYVVNDETFSYQINQGLEAYKRELYLPAAATFAVAIETFLIRLKRANNIKHKDSDSTMYDKLLEDLKQTGKINYRTKRRVEVAYNMRNIINHSQAGAVAKTDCDFLLNTLKDIVDANKEKLDKYNKSIDDFK